MIIQSASYAVPAGTDPNAPLFCFQNLVTASNVAAANQAAYPESNAANPSTAEEWRSSNPGTLHFFTISLGATTPATYLAIAKHNFGSAGIPIRIDGQLAAGNWVVLVNEVTLPDDKPAIFVFSEVAVQALRFRVDPSAVGVHPRAAVVYAGVHLRSTQKVYVGHAPITLNHQVSSVAASSSSGNFLGSVVVGRKTGAQLVLTDLDPVWVRGQLEPFLVHARDQRKPFFFAWRPHTYPRECGYVWLSGDPVITNARSNGMMSVTLDVEGVV